MRTAAKIISFIFHPLLLATYLVVMLGIFFPAMLMIRIDNLKYVALFVFGFTFALPTLNLLLFRWLTSLGQTKSKQAKGFTLASRFFSAMNSLLFESRQERKQPFVFVSIMYVIVAYLLPFSSSFSKLMIIVAALVVVATIFTFFIKVSVHSLAMGGWIGILLPLVKFTPDLLLPTAVVVALAGLVISSRLFLNAHTLRETMIGFITGVAVGYSGIIFLF